MQFPRRQDLRQKTGEPDGAAWIWGKDDELGRLNLQTPDTVKAAVGSVITGQVIPLNLPFDKPSPPCYARAAFQHNVVQLDKHAFDETYILNPQSTSQWDGFLHFSHVSTGLFYNGATAADILGHGKSHRCGIQAWANHGIVGRGILLDYGRYAELNDIKVEYYDNFKITYKDLVDVAKSQGIDLRPERDGGDIKPADILLIRSGFLKYDRSVSEEVRVKIHGRPTVFGSSEGQRYIGVEQSEEVLDLLHDCYFSAVAGDQPAFEAWPSDKDYYLHEYLLSLWGCPIGEFWDLERLGAACADNNRWIFLLSSTPNNVSGGVGSTSNALAIL
ncbi:hypothetical protein F5884DRAFT_825566 [Xylogone sp. PMI_703]|nr:hypothetical protein F5884DRAFT_825566 [Xylogone sp. PMI_703]